MSVRVSSLPAVTTCTTPTTSWPGARVKRSLATGSGRAGGSCASGGGGGGGGSRCEPKSEQALSATVRRAAGTKRKAGILMEGDYDRCRRTGAVGVLLQQDGLIRQFVVAATRAGEMTSQQRTHPQNAHDRAIAETPSAVVVLHLAAYRVPLRLRDPRCDTAVGDDLDVVIGHVHVDQHAVVVLGVPHPKLPEELQRARAWLEVAPQLGQIEPCLDHEADLATMTRLAFPDRLFDCVTH